MPKEKIGDNLPITNTFASANILLKNELIDIEIFYKDFCDFRIKLDEEVKTINNKLNRKPLSTPTVNQLGQGSTTNNNNTLDFLNLNTLNLNSNINSTDPNLITDDPVLNNTLNYFKETLKFVVSNMNNKLNREDLDKIQKQHSLDLDKLVR